MVLAYHSSSNYDRSIVVNIQKHFHADIAALTLVSVDGTKHIHAIASDYSGAVEILDAPIQAELFSARVISTSKTMSVRSLKLLGQKDRCPLMVAENYDAYLGIPLRTGKGTIGALQLVNSNERIWEKETVETLKQFAQPIISYLESDIPNSISELRLL